MTTRNISIPEESPKAGLADEGEVQTEVKNSAARGNWDDFDRITARVQDVPPVPGDEK